MKNKYFFSVLRSVVIYPTKRKVGFYSSFCLVPICHYPSLTCNNCILSMR